MPKGRTWCLYPFQGKLKVVSQVECKAVPFKANTDAGYSMVELLIGIFLIAGAALLVSQFSTQFDSEPTANRRACDTYATSFISLVAEETPYREILTYTPTAAAPARVPPNFTSGTRAVPNAATYGLPGGATPAERDAFQIAKGATEMPFGMIATASNGPRLQSFQLIQGSIRTLSTIYNRVPAVQCQFAPYAPITGAYPVPAGFSGATAIGVAMRLEPYRISTGASLCPAAGPPPALVFPGPMGLPNASQNVFTANSGRPDTAGYLGSYTTRATGAGVSGDNTGPFVMTEVVQTPPGTQTIAHRNAGALTVGDPDIGFRMQVRVNYTYEQPLSCVASQNFEYPGDRTQPVAPTAVVTANNSVAAGTAIWDHCAFPTGRPNNSGQVTMNVGYSGLPAGSVESGVQFLCKDLSWIRTPPPGFPPAGEMVACQIRSGGATTTQPRPAAPALRMNTTNNRQHNFTANKALRNRAWVSCDRLRQCGVNPSAVAVIGAGNPVNMRYQLSFNNLPFGCHMDFEAVAVDTAGNRSVVTAPRFLDKTPGFTATINAQTFSSRLDEIYRPTCGNTGPAYVAGLGVFCAPNPSWALIGALPPQYVNGYYTCRNHPSFGPKAGDPAATGCCVASPGNPDCRPWN